VVHGVPTKEEMVAGSSWPEGELLGFDLETTGTDVDSDVMVSFTLILARGDELLRSVCQIVNPGRSIPEGAVAIHGITTERALDEGISAGQALDLIVAELLSASVRGVPIVGMNLRYDLMITDRACRRADGRGLVERGWVGPAVDILMIDRHVDRSRSDTRTLAALCQHYKVKALTAHGAGGDAHSSLKVARRIAAHQDIAGLSLSDLHVRQITWHREWAESYSAWRVGKGMDRLPRSEGVWPISPFSHVR
jgi:DNA polymerase-3 subunit epsilon